MRRTGVVVFVLGMLVAMSSPALGRTPALIISSTASGQWTRSFSWEIAKSVAPETLQFPAGSSGVATWTVSVTKSSASDVFSVVGDICLTNNSPATPTSLSITDTVEYRLPTQFAFQILASAPVDLSDNPVLSGGESHCYSYAVDFVQVSGAEYRNRAVATVYIPRSTRPKTVTSTVGFTLPGSPSDVVNDSVNVSDSNGVSWLFSTTGSQSYEQTFTDSGTVTNTATIGETGQQTSASIEVIEAPS